MPVWKIMLIGVLAVACFTLAMSTLLAPLVVTGGQRWVWMAGLLVATACSSGVFALFLRYADRSLSGKTRGVRY